jgi:hypothetical protein
MGEKAWAPIRDLKAFEATTHFQWHPSHLDLSRRTPLRFVGIRSARRVRASYRSGFHGAGRCVHAVFKAICAALRVGQYSRLSRETGPDLSAVPM